jgi:hypothetical protein
VGVCAKAGAQGFRTVSGKEYGGFPASICFLFGGGGGGKTNTMILFLPDTSKQNQKKYKDFGMTSTFENSTVSLLVGYIQRAPFAIPAPNPVQNLTDAAEFFDLFCTLLVNIALLHNEQQDATLLKIIWTLMLAVHHPSATVLCPQTLYRACARVQGDEDIRHWIVEGLRLNSEDTIYVNASLDHLQSFFTRPAAS